MSALLRFPAQTRLPPSLNYRPPNLSFICLAIAVPSLVIVLVLVRSSITKVHYCRLLGLSPLPPPLFPVMCFVTQCLAFYHISLVFPSEHPTLPVVSTSPITPPLNHTTPYFVSPFSMTDLRFLSHVFPLLLFYILA